MEVKKYSDVPLSGMFGSSVFRRVLGLGSERSASQLVND